MFGLVTSVATCYILLYYFSHVGKVVHAVDSLNRLMYSWMPCDPGVVVFLDYVLAQCFWDVHCSIEEGKAFFYLESINLLG